jgi:hypothetical protein
MKRSAHYTPVFVARRVIARTIHHLMRHPIIVLLAAGLTTLLVVGVPTTLRDDGTATAATASDAGEQYMQGLRDHNVAELFGSLSPAMQRTLEQRSGRVGPAAVAAMFSEQDRTGERIVGYQLVGSYDTAQGDSLRFYVVEAERNGQRRDIPYTLTISSDGKVSNVE